MYLDRRFNDRNEIFRNSFFVVQKLRPYVSVLVKQLEFIR